jgi:RimJ/RimL family protein N-acetyltransferase
MEKIVLRALTEADTHTTLHWNNQEDIKNLYAGHPFPVNMEMEKDWYAKITKTNIPTTVFGIELKNEKKIIGLTFLKNINFIHSKAEFAIFIGDKNERGKGYSKEATLQTLRFAFNQLGLNRIYLFVQSNNIAAIKLYEKTGFQKEGELRNSVYKKGEFLNEIVMGIIKEDFKTNEL